jgi:hypothetical protein
LEGQIAQILTDQNCEYKLLKFSPIGIGRADWGNSDQSRVYMTSDPDHVPKKAANEVFNPLL